MSLRSVVGACTVGVPGSCLVSRVAAVLIPLALATAACASGASSPSQTALSSAAATTPTTTMAPASAAPASTSSTPTAAPTARLASPTPDGSPGDADASAPPLGSRAPSVAIDEALAAMLPATVDGLAVTRSADTESAAQGSPVLGAQADGFAAAQVISADAADLAIVSMIRLKPSTDAESFFDGYRPSYDDAACAPAGGVSTRETRTIGGRTVDTTLCVEGAVVYHLLLDDGRIIVSVLESGTKGYGRQLVEGLTG